MRLARELSSHAAVLKCPKVTECGPEQTCLRRISLADYPYYVSHAILQNRRVEAGNIARVPAPEIETLVCEGIRRHLAAMGDGEPAPATADRDLIERHVARVIVKPQALEVCLIPTCKAENHGPARAEIPKITGQRLGSASVTRGNVAGSHTPGNITPETRLPG